MATRCENCVLRERDAFIEMTSKEVSFMQRFKVGELEIEPGACVLMEGSNSPQLFTVMKGMGLRYKLLPDGRRQVVNFIFPGDFLGLQAGLMGEMGHSVEATSRMTLCVFDRAELWQLFRTHPERAFDLTWIAAVEENFLGDALLSVGQRSALASVAWALARIYLRGRQLDLVRDRRMPLPYRQQDLADALGLSLVHTNKTLARLRERQLAHWSQGDLRVNDIGALCEIAGIDPEAARKRPIL